MPITLDLQAEIPKMQLVWDLIPGDRDEIPDDILEPHEKCALHWMISYTVNTTFREEELLYNIDPPYGPWQRPPFNPAEGYQNDYPIPPRHFDKKNTGVIRKDIVYNPANPLVYNCDERVPHSLNPVEMGVIWTRAGPVASGAVIAGLAAGLRPQFRMWPSFLTSSVNFARRIDNVYGVTLAADLAQTALLKKRGQSYTGPDGYFNTSLCPADFLLTSDIPSNSFNDPTFTHLTIAEINGGIDGLILGLHANDWERRSELSLSQVCFSTL